LEAAVGLGMGVSRIEERVMCAIGLFHSAPIRFESCQTVPYGGVMLLLPFLLECGLMSYRNHYPERQMGFYNYDGLMIVNAFMYLCRIKSFEQIKQYSPGEFGKLVGYDRIPEVKTLRGMISEITAQHKADEWAAALSQSWISEESPELYYIDGHVQVYHGYLAKLGKKHVSRQRLCLPGVMEFWVNASDGNPYFYVTADVNEKMGEILTDDIVPELLRLHPVSDAQKQKMEADPDEPVFTLIFDRESYSPTFFTELWEKHGIAVITYRKNAKEQWDESLFEDYTVPTILEDETIKLCERIIGDPAGRNQMREVRKLNADGHQTSIVTTNKILPIVMIASYMFGRWVQENFFRYMRLDYAFDKIVQYSINELDGNIKVVNVEYNNLSYKIKNAREKLARVKANLYEIDQKNPLTVNDPKTGKRILKSRLNIIEKKAAMEKEIDELVKRRKEVPYKIPISQMPEKSRYNQLNNESKLLQNVIKMICYRAETALANLLAPHYKRAEQEIRMLVKAIIQSPINMEVDHKNEELRITLYPLSNIRSNEAIAKICDTINETCTIFPGTNLRLNYKIATS
jgi:predicted  nucleic acid-binding Zn-ribbon protein